eukprot:9504063-Pyramimonas_sp.AAC.3
MLQGGLWGRWENWQCDWEVGWDFRGILTIGFVRYIDDNLINVMLMVFQLKNVGDQCYTPDTPPVDSRGAIWGGLRYPTRSSVFCVQNCANVADRPTTHAALAKRVGSS